MRELHRGLAALAGHVDLDHRHAGLVEEAAHRLRERVALAARFGQRRDEVIGTSAAECTTREVGAHARAEALLADPAFEHREHRGALLVGDRIERGHDVAFAADRLAHLARAEQAVVRHRREATFERLEVGVVLGLERRRRLRLGPGRVRLVEPDVVPPRHGDEVAVPLVRDLVRLDVEHRAVAIGRRIRPDQQQCIAIDDESRVLHRARGEIRRTEQVELVEWIRLRGVLLEERDDRWRGLERPPEPRTAAARADAAKRHGVLADRVRRDRGAFDDLPGTDRERDEVGRQRRRGGEFERLPRTIIGARFAQLARVRNRDVLCGHREAQFERRLEARLVEARECVARADRLHLRDRVRIVADHDLVEAFELLVERRVVIDFDQQRLRGQRARKPQLEHARGFVQRDARLGLAARGIGDDDAADLQRARVQPQHVARAREFHADARLALEAIGARVDRQVQRVVLGLDPVGKLPARHFRGGNAACGEQQDGDDAQQHGPYPSVAGAQDDHGRCVRTRGTRSPENQERPPSAPSGHLPPQTGEAHFRSPDWGKKQSSPSPACGGRCRAAADGGRS